MGTVLVGNGFYFIYIAAALVYIAALALIAKRLSRKAARALFLALLFFNFALHFLKQAFPPYINDFPGSLKSSGLQNLCAVSTVFFPFIYLFKKQNVLHDYAYFIGLCGGLGALFYPTEALGYSPVAFDTLRFYFTHINLLAVPLAAAVSGIYVPRLKMFWAVPLLFLAQQTVIFLYELFLVGVGAVQADVAKFLDAGFRNSSFTFGVRSDFAAVKFLFDPLVPAFFKTDAFNINGGKPFYFPVLWMIVPAFVYLIPVYVIISSPFWIISALKTRRSKSA